MSGALLPTSRREMQERGWRELDVLLVTGDAYVDHPSYGAALIGRLLEVGDVRRHQWIGQADGAERVHQGERVPFRAEQTDAQTGGVQGLLTEVRGEEQVCHEVLLSG